MQRKLSDDENMDVDIEDMELDDDDKKFHYIMTADDSESKIKLP